MNNNNTATIRTDTGVIRRMDDLNRLSLTKGACVKAGFHEGSAIEIHNGKDENGMPVIILRQYHPENDVLETPQGTAMMNAIMDGVLGDSEMVLTVCGADETVLRSFGNGHADEDLLSKAIRGLKKMSLRSFAFQNAAIAGCRYKGEILSYLILTGPDCSTETNLSKLELAATVFATLCGSSMRV